MPLNQLNCQDSGVCFTQCMIDGYKHAATSEIFCVIQKHNWRKSDWQYVFIEPV